ncbi:MAG TPA: 6-phosphogluconolactonase [Methylomirabilota bacterium]|nr:6-phosphogluconolactonase [Methylomirabilota bacterium]
MMFSAMDPKPEIEVLDDATALADAAARAIVEIAEAAVKARRRFTVALAGGNTPRTTYERLAASPQREQMPWDRTWIFFGDERAVPPDHPDSNYRMANAALLSKVPVPSAQVARIRGEAEDSEVAAADYTRVIAEAFGSRRGELPSFDLILLGMGVDGHTASLFPGSPVLKEVFRPVAAVHAAAAAIPERLTFTFPLINAAARVMFLVAGSEKAKVVKAVMTDSGTSLPASMVRPINGRLTWLLDRPAAALLGPGKRR